MYDFSEYFCLFDFTNEYQVLENLPLTFYSIFAPLSKISWLYLCGSISGLQKRIVLFSLLCYVYFSLFVFFGVFLKFSYSSG